MEIRVFVWWFLYIRVCILKFYATKTEEGVRRKQREKKGWFPREKFFSAARCIFGCTVKKSLREKIKKPVLSVYVKKREKSVKKRE